MNNETNLDPIKDQFLLEDKAIIERMVSFANLNKNDTVLEIGAGTGNLTKEIAKYAGNVIAYEIDKKFKSYLNSLPKNVDLRYEKTELTPNFRDIIISNPPFSLIESLLHQLIFINYKKVILVVPKKTLKTIKASGIFNSFFTAKILMDIPAQSFNPIPKTSSVIIDLMKQKDPIETENIELFLRQYIYQHKNQLVKNSLMEGIIRYKKRTEEIIITKNEARKMITNAFNDKKFTKLLNSKPEGNTIYNLVSEKFKV